MAQTPAQDNLPTSGPFGTEPSLSVGGIMMAVTLVVTFLTAAGIYTPSPELIEWGKQWGVLAAGGIIATMQLIQALWTRFRVYAPASLPALLRRG